MMPCGGPAVAAGHKICRLLAPHRSDRAKDAEILILRQSALVACYSRSGMIPIVYPHAWRSRRAVVTFGSRAPVS